MFVCLFTQICVNRPGSWRMSWTSSWSPSVNFAPATAAATGTSGQETAGQQHSPHFTLTVWTDADICYLWIHNLNTCITPSDNTSASSNELCGRFLIVFVVSEFWGEKIYSMPMFILFNFFVHIVLYLKEHLIYI